MFTEAQQSTLRALADTVVAAVPVPPGGPDSPVWALSASSVGADLALVEELDRRLDPVQAAGLAQLLDALALLGFAAAALPVREALLATVARISDASAAAVASVSSLVRLLTLGLPGPQGANPFWTATGYPGPQQPCPDVPKPLALTPPPPDGRLEADVVVVGSGAGGGVVAAELARAGRQVVVLEAGQYLAERDFTQLELDAYARMYWRGGPTATAEGNVTILAGATLGGGTTVNWTNWVATYPRVRAQWAHEAGLADLETPDFDRHLEVVGKRVEANSDCNDENHLHQHLRQAAAELGWSYRSAVRNTDRSRYSPQTAGYMGFGDTSGAKLGTLATFLPDALECGARLMVGCRVERVLVEDGRASGVQAVQTLADGSTRSLTVRAATVVLAAGALETPVILLASGLGGPAAGDYLRLHPCVALTGLYPGDEQGWWGAPQVGLVDEFSDLTEGYGFLVEGIQYAPALAAAASPWRDPRAFKELMAHGRSTTSFIALTRDRGHGRVSLGPDGRGVVSYPVDDPLDRTHLRAGLAALARLHEAAGAERILATTPLLEAWTRGQDLEEFIVRLQALELGAAGLPLFSAHQMGTARMGLDPATSCCDPRGELHGTPGVWIADTSAYPTATGGNPMATCMALAHRTAHLLLSAGERTR